MKKDRGRDILFSVYLLAVLSLAFIYFTVPERRLFIENQLEWWEGMWDVIQSFL